MTALERMGKEIELDAVKIAMKQMMFQIAKCKAEIERYESNMEGQKKKIAELEQELKAV